MHDLEATKAAAIESTVDPPRQLRWLVLALLGLLLLQVTIAASRDSVTVDETVHLPLGLYFLAGHDFSVDPINPPLGRMLAVLPVMADDLLINQELGRFHWRLAFDFMQRHAEVYHHTFAKARAMTVFWLLLLAVTTYRFAGELGGRAAGRGCLFLFVLTPDLLAHGHLVTLDVVGTLGFVGTLYATWRLRRRATWPATLALGICLGLANAIKLWNALLVPLVVILLLLAWRRGSGQGGPGRAQLVRLTAVLLIALLSLSLSYGFAGFLAPWRTIEWAGDSSFASLAETLPGLRLPLPAPYLRGVDKVLSTGGTTKIPLYYLAGELSAEGWWYYHLVALALKTPLALLVLMALGVGRWFRQSKPGHSCDPLLFVGLPVLVVFAANIFFNSQQIGVRHMLAATTLLLIPAGATLASLLQVGQGRRAEVARASGLLLAGGLLVATLAVAPRYLQFVNLLGGGARGGHHWLSDSNNDWGQDFRRLHDYVETQGIEQIRVIAASRVDPAVYDLPVAAADAKASGGWLAVSSSFVVGRPYFTVQEGQLVWLPENQLSWLQDSVAVARVGAFFIYLQD